LVLAVVAFWVEGGDIGPFLSIKIFIPSHWSPVEFLFQLGISIDNCSIIPLLNTYILDETSSPFNAINTEHCNYFKDNQDIEDKID